MRSALLLTSSESTRQLVGSILGRRTNLILVSLGEQSTGTDFDSAFRTWISLADVFIIDCISLGEQSKPVLESLGALSAEEACSVVVLMTSLQRTLHAALLSTDWLVLGEKTSAEDFKQLLGSFVDLRYARLRSRKQEELDRLRNGSRSGPMANLSPETAVPLPVSPNSYRYRDALKQMSRLLAQPASEAALIRDFLALLSELLGLSRSALLLRESHLDLGGRNSAPLEDNFLVAASIGMASKVTDQLRLNIACGIPQFLASEARILCRNRVGPFLTGDATLDIEQEFEQLKTDVALPVFANDDLTGIFTCSGKITGEPLTNEELELSYHLVRQLGNAILGIRLNSRVRRQERFMSQVLAEIQSGVLVLGSDCRVLVLNDRARQLLDLGTEDPVKSSQLPARVADVVFETLKTGVEIRRREVTLPRSGTLLSVSAIRLEPDGKQGAAVSLIEDLSVVRSQEIQTQRLKEQELFMRLAYRLSHELKNSLVSVKTFIQLLPQYSNEEKAQGNFANLVLDEVGRIDSVVQNLGFFAQSPEIVFEDIPVSELVQESIDEAARRAVYRKLANLVQPERSEPDSTELPVIAVRVSLNHKHEVIRGDRKRLTQVLQELVLNAAQSMPSGGRILISSCSSEDALTIEIKDTGHGISLENLGRITEPFFTTRNVGVGLGLTVVEKILSWHSGRLTIDSKLGQGSTVAAHLPVRPPGASEEKAVSNSVAADVIVERKDSRTS
jgi:signal transduction histidine kinase